MTGKDKSSDMPHTIFGAAEGDVEASDAKNDATALGVSLPPQVVWAAAHPQLADHVLLYHWCFGITLFLNLLFLVLTTARACHGVGRADGSC